MRSPGVSEMVESSFGEFYALRKDPVYRAVLLATRRPTDAEDAVADAFVRACERWDVLRNHPDPNAWVMRTAMNRFISGWRRWRREQPDPPDLPMLVPDQAGSLDPYLLRLLWRLPRRQREVIALRILADLDGRATATALGIAAGTVGVHLARGLATLRQGLAGTAYEEAAR